MRNRQQELEHKMDALEDRMREKKMGYVYVRALSASDQEYVGT